MSLRLKRHETFCAREGWLEKGINILQSNPQCFSKDSGPKNFGLGSNMCKSLRYWLEATRLAYFTGKGAFLTPFGEFVLKVDPFIEKLNTLWLIHVNLVTNAYDAPVINKIFNLKENMFTKDFLVEKLNDMFIQENEYVNRASLDADVSVAIRTYFAEKNTDPENNINSIFSNLGLFYSENKKDFLKKSPDYSKLDYRIVYYSIIKCFNNTSEEISFNIEDLYERDNNPLNIFNISKSALFSYFEEMKNNHLIKLIKTAGLNMVRINKIQSLEKLFMGEKN